MDLNNIKYSVNLSFPLHVLFRVTQIAREDREAQSIEFPVNYYIFAPS